MAYRHQRGEITRLEPGRGERPMLQMVAEFNDHGLAVIIGKPQRIDRVRRKNATLVVVDSQCQAAIRPQHFQELFIILGHDLLYGVLCLLAHVPRRANVRHAQDNHHTRYHRTFFHFFPYTATMRRSHHCDTVFLHKAGIVLNASAENLVICNLPQIRQSPGPRGDRGGSRRAGAQSYGWSFRESSLGRGNATFSSTPARVRTESAPNSFSWSMTCRTRVSGADT